MRGEMIRDSSGAKEKEEEPFLFLCVFKGCKSDSRGALKGALRLPGGNVIPAC